MSRKNATSIKKYNQEFQQKKIKKKQNIAERKIKLAAIIKKHNEDQSKIEKS